MPSLNLLARLRRIHMASRCVCGHPKGGHAEAGCYAEPTEEEGVKGFIFCPCREYRRA